GRRRVSGRPSPPASRGTAPARREVPHQPRAPIPGAAAAANPGRLAPAPEARVDDASRARPPPRDPIQGPTVMPHNAFDTLKEFRLKSGRTSRMYSLPELARSFPNVAKLPVSLRIVLESVLRNVDGKKITEAHVAQLANWKPNDRRVDEIPFVVARNVAARMGQDPKRIEPLVPVDLVVDHSVMIDHYRRPDALDLNMKLEFERNRERYQFMKWGMQAFDTFKVVPPGIGIVHQVNLE